MSPATVVDSRQTKEAPRRKPLAIWPICLECTDFGGPSKEGYRMKLFGVESWYFDEVLVKVLCVSFGLALGHRWFGSGRDGWLIGAVLAVVMVVVCEVVLRAITEDRP